MTMSDDSAHAESTATARVYRHALATRITHWVNALCIAILLLSGLQILNAHPRLYWGQYGAHADTPFISFEARRNSAGEISGVTRIGAVRFDSTGFLGASEIDGAMQARGFPAWLTFPASRSLGAGRNWHFFFAWALVLNGLAYLYFSFRSRHVQRDLALRREELKPTNLLHEIVRHAQLKPPRGEESLTYNTLQKLAYLSVIFALIPLIVLTGLTMSPGMNAAAPVLIDLFGGRQSARTIHFLCAFAIVLFVFVHVFEVFVAGVWNEMRSMITGWYVVKPEKKS